MTLVDYLVIKNVAFDVYISTNHVVDNDLLSWLHKEANHILLTVIDELLDL